jgi:hypothetical protein
MAIPTEQPAVNGHAETNGHTNRHTNGHTNGTAPLPETIPTEKPPHPRYVPLNNQYGYTPRKLRVITIGAGFSGLLMAHKIQHRFKELEEYVTHTIFEMRKDIGGTWLVNNYPGVQCDVPGS